MFATDEHTLWYKEDDDQQERRWQQQAERTQTAMETVFANKAEGGQAVREQLAVSTRKTTDFRAFLRRFAALREEVSVDADSFDYGYYAYGLRHFGNMPLIEPLETREVRKIEDFVIAIDTSMSTSGELVRAFLSRTYEILQENTSFFRHFNLRILQCDDQLRSDKKVTNARELAEYMEHFELIGQSATDFRPVFEYVDRLNAEGAFRHLRGLLYFTDGLGIYPKKRPKYDAAFVMLEGEAYPDKVPSWGIRAVISEDALSVEWKKDALRVLFCSSVIFHPFGDRLLDFLYLQRLCQMGIHACGEALLCILVKGVCGHGDDGQRFRVRSVERANGLRSVNAVHHRHHHIHENRVECVRWIVLHDLHSLFAIRDDGYGRLLRRSAESVRFRR